MKEVLSSEIWSLCPKLKQIRYLGPFPDEPPPDEHPIFVRDVGESWLLDGDIEEEHWVWNWPSIGIIRLQSSWDTLAWRHGYRTVLRSLGSLALEDNAGEKYEEWVSRGRLRRWQQLSGRIDDNFL